MKKHIFFIMLSYYSFSFTMRTEPLSRIKLPSSEVLKQRFLALEYHDFLTFSQIHAVLGDTKKTPATVVSYVISTLNQYTEYNNKKRAIKPAPLSQEKILWEIFQDYPSVIESLRKQNLLP